VICQEFEIGIVSTRFQNVMKFGKDQNKKKRKVGYQTSESGSSDMHQVKKSKRTMFSFGEISDMEE